MSSESEEIDYGQIATELQKAGLVTKDDMTRAITEGFKNFKLPSVDMEKVTIGEVMKHMKQGCDDEDCKITKGIEKIFSDAYVRGTYHGIKLGQYGASKGVRL